VSARFLFHRPFGLEVLGQRLQCHILIKRLLTDLRYIRQEPLPPVQIHNDPARPGPTPGIWCSPSAPHLDRFCSTDCNGLECPGAPSSFQPTWIFQPDFLVTLPGPPTPPTSFFDKLGFSSGRNASHVT